MKMPTGKIEMQGHISLHCLWSSDVGKIDQRQEIMTPTRLRLAAVDGRFVVSPHPLSERPSCVNPTSIAGCNSASNYRVFVIAAASGMVLFWMVTAFLSDTRF
jgi:hypothetical protein